MTLSASAEGFTGQPGVINGASELLGEIFGDEGKHARSAVGVAELPIGAPVEIELIVETTTLAGTVAQASSTTTHGSRIETRAIAVSDAMAGLSDWPGRHQVMKLERTVINKTTGEVRDEIVYGVTSLSPPRATPAQLNELWRKHWTIENKLHWVRDVTFDEDRSQVRSGNAPQVMAALRNIAISALRLRKVTNIAAALRRYAARPALAFTAIGI